MTIPRAAAIAVFVSRLLAAQQFDAASIKADNPELSQGGAAHMVRMPVGGYSGINITLKSLIMSAYQINENQLTGGPPWLDSAGWDIETKYSPANRTQFPQMMQALLADRFHLVIHRETKVLPIYALTVAKNGPKLQEVAGNPGGSSAGARMIRYASVAMPELAGQLSGYLGRQVVDQTDLKARYKVDLAFARVQLNGNDDTADAGPSIFTALQEQLGLKLESTKGPVEVIVVDSIDRPTPN